MPWAVLVPRADVNHRSGRVADSYLRALLEGHDFFDITAIGTKRPTPMDYIQL